MENYEKKFVVDAEGETRQEDFTPEEKEKIRRLLSKKTSGKILSLNEDGRLVVKDKAGNVVEEL